jgi:hypothetical protein
VPVAVYRLLQYTMREALIRRYGEDAARSLLVEAGFRAGEEFCRHTLTTGAPLPAFLAELQARLRELRIGLLRVERHDPDKGELLVTIAEDLDCSGLPVTDKTVCDYDEGFLAGILSVQTGRQVTAKEIDCWSTGARVCRFAVTIGGPQDDER